MAHFRQKNVVWSKNFHSKNRGTRILNPSIFKYILNGSTLDLTWTAPSILCGEVWFKTPIRTRGIRHAIMPTSPTQAPMTTLNYPCSWEYNDAIIRGALYQGATSPTYNKRKVTFNNVEESIFALILIWLSHYKDGPYQILGQKKLDQLQLFLNKNCRWE